MGGLFLNTLNYTKMKIQHTCPILNIRYSKEAEISRVKDILDKASWYKEQGYAKIVRLPGGVTLEEIKGKVEEDILLASLDEEYNESLFRKTALEIEKKWLDMCKKWPSRDMESMGINFHRSYEIHLTRYGTGGSYDKPNDITLNIYGKETEMLARIVFHEMLHLAIEPLIEKYNIPHWRKERLVDILYKKLLPEFSFEQNIPKEAHIPDNIFEKYTGNIETAVKIALNSILKVNS